MAGQYFPQSAYFHQKNADIDLEEESDEEDDSDDLNASDADEQGNLEGFVVEDQEASDSDYEPEATNEESDSDEDSDEDEEYELPPIRKSSAVVKLPKPTYPLVKKVVKYYGVPDSIARPRKPALSKPQAPPAANGPASLEGGS